MTEPNDDFPPAFKREVVAEFKNGKSVLKLSYLFAISPAAIEGILREFVRPGGEG